MRIDEIKLQNFRCFPALTLELHAQMTVLVGENAAGKTAALEALAVGLGGFLRGFDGLPVPHILPGDVRHVVREIGGQPDEQRQFPASVSCRGIVDGKPNVQWTRSVDRPGGRTTRTGARKVEALAHRIQYCLMHGDPEILPVLGYYGTQRLWLLSKDTKIKRGVGSRTDGYLDCLRPESNFKQLLAWFAKEILGELPRGVLAASGRLGTSQRAAGVEAAVASCLGDVDRVWYDFAYDDLRVRTADGNLQALAELSDGYRTMVAMVADIARRCASLNPQFVAAAPQETAGVVLIDEIDLHLHPKWQRRVLADLIRTFPKIQFVVTTHSPQVLASCKPEWVRILSADGTVQRVDYIHGWDSNTVLREIMGDASRPQFVTDGLARISVAIHDGLWEAAENEIAKLQTDLGPEFPDLASARLDLDFERRMAEGDDA